LLYVTGVLGGSAAGLNRLRKKAVRSSNFADRAATDNAGPLAPHLWPEPRIEQGLWLQRRGAATAAIDLSDGLSTDLDHICLESGVGAEIDEAALPVFDGAMREQALHGGEDYELLFAARPNTRIPVRIGGVPVRQIGRVVKTRSNQTRLVLITKTGREPLSRGGWEHFA
jgi:thiamine-monophosphate kinase